MLHRSCTAGVSQHLLEMCMPWESCCGRWSTASMPMMVRVLIRTGDVCLDGTVIVLPKSPALHQCPVLIYHTHPGLPLDHLFHVRHAGVRPVFLPSCPSSIRQLALMCMQQDPDQR
jgi:hypothetical protein